MWLIIISLVYGALVALDPVLFVFIGYNLNVHGMYMGLLSALWSIAYIVASRIFDRFADEGRNKFLMLISLSMLGASYLCFSSLNYVTAVLAYVIHAISVASANLSISITVLENVDNELWRVSSIVQRSLTSLSRGVVLFMLSFKDLFSIYYLFYIILAFKLFSFLLLPSTVLSFERKFYKLNKSLEGIGMYIKASSSILFIDKPSMTHHVFSLSWNKWNSIPLYKITISIAMATALGDYIFIILPLILKNYMDITNIWMAYGVASIFSAVIVVVFKDFSASSRSFAVLLIAVRMFILIMGLSIVKDLFSLTTYVILSSLLYMLIDIVLYNMFIEASAGFSTASYFISREIGSILGSLISGIMIGFGNTPFLAVAIVIGISAVFPLL